MNYKKVIGLGLLLLSFELSASTRFRDVTITGTGVFLNSGKGILLISIDGDKSSMAACATTKRFAIDSSIANYQEVLSLVMAAYVSGQNKVSLHVDETCSSWGNAQDVRGIKMGTMPW